MSPRLSRQLGHAPHHPDGLRQSRPRLTSGFRRPPGRGSGGATQEPMLIPLTTRSASCSWAEPRTAPGSTAHFYLRLRVGPHLFGAVRPGSRRDQRRAGRAVGAESCAGGNRPTVERSHGPQPTRRAVALLGCPVPDPWKFPRGICRPSPRARSTRRGAATTMLGLWRPAGCTRPSAPGRALGWQPRSPGRPGRRFDLDVLARPEPARRLHVRATLRAHRPRIAGGLLQGETNFRGTCNAASLAPPPGTRTSTRGPATLPRPQPFRSFSIR